MYYDGRYIIWYLRFASCTFVALSLHGHIHTQLLGHKILTSTTGSYTHMGGLVTVDVITRKYQGTAT